MFALNKIIDSSPCGNYVVILLKDVPDGCLRTTRTSYVKNALKSINSYSFEYTGPGDSEQEVFVAVKTADLKKIHPAWFVTKDDLLSLYQEMQREGEPIKDPVLLQMAKELWSEHLALLRKKT